MDSQWWDYASQRPIADRELPFAIKAPNAASCVAIAEAGEIIKSRRASFDDVEKPNASKWANLPRACGYTKSFPKDHF